MVLILIRTIVAMKQYTGQENLTEVFKIEKALFYIWKAAGYL